MSVGLLGFDSNARIGVSNSRTVSSPWCVHWVTGAGSKFESFISLKNI